MPVKLITDDGRERLIKPITLKKAIKYAGEKAEIGEYYEKQLESDVAAKVLKNLKGEKEISPKELRQKIVEELKNVEHAAAEMAREMRNFDEEELF